MADILTQMQDEVDMLLNIMQSQLTQIRLRAPPSTPEGQQKLSSFAEKEATDRTEAQSALQSSTQNPSQPTDAAPAQPTKAQFEEDLKEMAKDLVVKSQQIELLIANLPGVNSSEAQQVSRMKELERELEELEGERVGAVKEREELLKKVEGKIVGVGRAR